MKKMAALVLVVMLYMLCVPMGATAEKKLYSISELPAHTASRWQQTYTAHGRTIDVDVDVYIPPVSSAPVITVRRADPLSEPLNSELEAEYKQAEKEDRVNRYAYRSNDFSTNFTHALPPAWGKDRDSEFVVGAMSQRRQDLYDYDLDTAYAENNPLTIGEAMAIFQQRVAAYFPQETLHLRSVYMTSRSFYKKNHQPISEKGYYSFNMSQTFHGIPFMASIHEAFTQFAVGNEDAFLKSRGVARGSVHDENAWAFNACFYQESGVVCQDIPLLPFDAVKGAVEALILSGHVRWIDSVSLGYVQFDASSPEEQVLVPCYVVWCEYHPGGPQSERSAGENSSENLLYDGNNDYYRPLILHAQTGEMIDPENTSLGRCLCPALTMDGQPDELISLKILGGVSERIMQQYMAEHPHVRILLDPRESSFLGLQEALVSGDESIDLFLVSSDGVYTEAIEKGYGAPLSSSAYLRNRVDQFYPWAQGILKQNGELFAIPVSFSSDYWTINRTKWRALGLGSYPQTYEELFAIASTWAEEYAEDHPEVYVFECPDEMPGMIRLMIRQYLWEHEDWAAPVNFDTPEFRAAMESVMAHPDVFTYDGERMALIMGYPQYLGTGYNDEDLVESFLPPALSTDSDQVVGGRMELLVMNPSSRQKEEALRFMEFYMAHLDPQIAYSLDASCTQPLRPSNYESNRTNLRAEIQGIEAQMDAATDPAARAELVEKLGALQRRYARLESTWRFSAEDIAIYQGIAEKTVMPTQTIYPAGGGSNTESFDAVIDQFAAGSMPLDQFIRILNEKAKIMFLEMD